MRSPKSKMCSKTVWFGHEHVLILSQTFRRLFINSLIVVIFLGDNYSKMEEGERVYKTKRVTILHLSCLTRMKEIFMVADLCAVSILNISSNNTHTCCGKVNTIKDGKNLIGYILDEVDNKWCVMLANNKMVQLNKVVNCHDIKKYMYPKVVPR